MAEILTEAGLPVIMVTVGEQYERVDNKTFTVHPGEEAHLRRLFEVLDAEGRLPEAIVIAWNDSPIDFDDERQRSMATFMYLAKTLHAMNITRDIKLVFIGHHALDFSGLTEVHPAQAMPLGPCKTIREEFPNIQCRFLDIAVPPEYDQRLKLARKIARDIVLTGIAIKQGLEGCQQPHKQGDAFLLEQIPDCSR